MAGHSSCLVPASIVAAGGRTVDPVAAFDQCGVPRQYRSKSPNLGLPHKPGVDPAMHFTLHPMNVQRMVHDLRWNLLPSLRQQPMMAFLRGVEQTEITHLVSDNVVPVGFGGVFTERAPGG